MSILSLCTGYGGLDRAVEEATGERTAWTSEIDPQACEVVAARFPDAVNLGDLKTIEWSTLDGVTTITAGYPCQPFSQAGRRKGEDDPRHIWPWIIAAIRVVRPRLVVLENVRGHLTKGFGTVLGDLADAGYDARWTCVRASDVGAPHRRERVFIVASDADCLVGSSGLPVDRRSGTLGEPGAVQQAVRPDRLDSAADAVCPGAGRDARGLPREADEGRRSDVDLRPARHAGADTPWGDYGPAIERWERLTRPAPEPTTDGRLSPLFVEWMMGLPAGWVTDIVERRTHALRILGNGVVPQQAALALEVLL